jgi:thiamine biosynthesis lipoprotein
MQTVDNGRSGPSRRAFVSLGIGAFAVAVTPRILRAGPRLYRRSVPVMGTVADIAVVHRDDATANAAIGAAIEALHRTESAMTWFRADSEVGRANAMAARDAVAVSSQTADVVSQSLRWAEATDGAFDPAIGKVVRTWDVTHRTEPPARRTTQRFAGRRLYRHVEVGTRQGRPALRFHDPDVALDLGGIGKGWGVDRATDALRDWGISDAIVNVGGDLRAIGCSADGDPWRVGIRSPDQPSRIRSTFDVHDQAVATSGDYEQAFLHQGRAYHHLLDPRTAEPRQARSHSITIAADLCVTADAAATALFGTADTDIVAAVQRIAPDAVIIDAG